MFSIAGVSTLALKVVPIALQALAAVLTWRVGLRVTSRRAAALAGALVWVWPGAYVWWSTKERGFYEMCLCLSVAVVLVALQIAQPVRLKRRAELARWALLGLFAGLGFWESPQILYSLLPVAAWLVIWHRRRCGGVVVAIPAFLAGSRPWIVWNATNRWRGLEAQPPAVHGGYASHLGTLARSGLPTLLGLRVAYTQRWLLPRFHRELYALALIALVVGLVHVGRRGSVLLVILAAFPLLHAVYPSSGYVGEGRYLYFMLPWIALAIASAARTTLTALAIVTVAIAVSVADLVDMRQATSPYLAGEVMPTDLGPLEAALRSHGITRAWADYWVAYRVTFETDGGVIVAPTWGDRYPPYDQLLARAAHPADIFLSGTRPDVNFSAGLAARNIAAARFAAGPWVIYVPSRPTPPSAIPGAVK